MTPSKFRKGIFAIKMNDRHMPENINPMPGTCESWTKMRRTGA